MLGFIYTNVYLTLQSVPLGGGEGGGGGGHHHLLTLPIHLAHLRHDWRGGGDGLLLIRHLTFPCTCMQMCAKLVSTTGSN